MIILGAARITNGEFAFFDEALLILLSYGLSRLLQLSFHISNEIINNFIYFDVRVIKLSK